MSRLGRAAALLTLGVTAALAARSAEAATLEVAPVTVELAGGAHAAAMTITNHDNGSVYVQVRGMSWAQTARDDQLNPTDDLIVAPPIFQLAANASQVVRVVLQKDAGNEERTYRLLVDQVPTAAKQSGVTFALRLSIPVFVEPEQAGKASLSARIGPDNSLVVTNNGTKRTRLFDVVLRGAGPIKLGSPPNPYVLAGVSRSWSLNGPVGGGAMTLTAKTDDGPISLSVGSR